MHKTIFIGFLYPFKSGLELDGTIIVEWNLPGDSQEGVALWAGLSPGQAQVFVAEDNGEVWRYDFNSQCNITIIGGGSVNLVPDPPSYYGTNDTLTAIPDTGYQFMQWSGDLTGSQNPAVLFMDYDKDVTATFEYVGITENTNNKSIKPYGYLGATVLSGPINLPEDKSCRILNVGGQVVVPDRIKPGIYFIEIDGKIRQKVVKIK